MFCHPGKVSHALHSSPFSKYILGGETRSLGNGSALILAVWEHNLAKTPLLLQNKFTLGN